MDAILVHTISEFSYGDRGKARLVHCAAIKFESTLALCDLSPVLGDGAMARLFPHQGAYHSSRDRDELTHWYI